MVCIFGVFARIWFFRGQFKLSCEHALRLVLRVWPYDQVENAQ
jgi:hypothetical protein